MCSPHYTATRKYAHTFSCQQHPNADTLPSFPLQLAAVFHFVFVLAFAFALHPLKVLTSSHSQRQFAALPGKIATVATNGEIA